MMCSYLLASVSIQSRKRALLLLRDGQYSNDAPWIHAFGEDDGCGGEDDGCGGEDDGRGGEDDGCGGEDDGRGGEDDGCGGEDNGRGGEDDGRGAEDTGRGAEDTGGRAVVKGIRPARRRSMFERRAVDPRLPLQVFYGSCSVGRMRISFTAMRRGRVTT